MDLKTVVLCSTVLFVSCQNDGKISDSLVDMIFGNTSTSTESQVTRKPTNPNGGFRGIADTDSCACVLYLCSEDGFIETSGTYLIDINEDEETPLCEGFFEVYCCKKANKVSEPITPTPPTARRNGCGYRNPKGIGFTITGDKNNEAQFGEFPWMVAILREETIQGSTRRLNVYQCGGALIHPEVVVTAAHCVSGSDKQFKIRAGEWDTQHNQEILPHQEQEVGFITVHPEYSKGSLFNDLALLFLKAPVTIAENVNVVCLSPPNQTIDNATCVASGWGRDVFGKEGKYQVILKKIELPIVARDPCQQALRLTRLGKFFELHRSFICAGGEPDKDTCKGDGVSPLVCPIDGHENRYALTGIVAWGIGCGDSDTPGIYVNVALFRDWIDKQMALSNIDSKWYEYQ